MASESDILYIGFVLGHGGDAIQMASLGAGMAERGSRVRVVVPELETTVKLAEWCRTRGVQCERSPWVRADPTGVKQSPGELVKLLRHYRAPVVHFHTGDISLPRAALLALELVETDRVFATLHSPYASIEPGSSRAEVWSWSVRRRFDAIVSPSLHGADAQRRLGVPADKIRTIPNGVDIARFSSGDGRLPRRELGISDDAPLIVFTSRMDQQKRPLDVLRAFHEISGEFPDSHLAFVGQGELTGAAQEYAREHLPCGRTHFMGQREDIPDWLAAATVWTLPTEAENFSMAVLEALAAGTAVLSTLCRGNDEILVDGRNALIHAIGGEGMTEGLRRLLSDPSLRQRLGQEARRTAQRFSLSRMTDAYAELYAVPALRSATPAVDVD